MRNDLLLLSEVAAEARVSVSTVRHWIRVGKLRTVRPGLPGACRHDEQEAVLSPSHGLDDAVDGLGLEVARSLAARVGVIRLADDLLDLGCDVPPLAVAAPEFVVGRKRIERKLGLGLGRTPGAIVEKERIAVRRENERHVDHLGVLQGLLHPGADHLVVVFGLHDGDGRVASIEDVV
jgi:hypothetical protein